MVELPRGTVTFVFTDIEGSTALVKRLRDRYGEVVEQHQLLLRASFEAHGGHEIDTQGDSFFFAFARAKGAVLAVVDAQRAVTDYEWPEGGEVRVRMGLHTGEPVVGEQRYTGFGVNRAARISAAGHGGQVLLSNATRELVEDELPEDVAIRDLGTYRLKDVDRPEHLFQLVVDDLPSEFPPLKAAEVKSPHPLRRRAILLSALAGVIAAAVAIPIFALAEGESGGSIDVVGGNSVGFVDPDSKRLVADISVGATPTHLALGDGAVWVTNADGDSVSRIDPLKRIVVQTISIGNSPSGITTGNGAVWVSNSLDSTVSRIDPATNTVVQTIPVGNGPLGIAYAAGSIWVANTGDETITRIDAGSGEPRKTLPIAANELAFGAGTLWASQSNANRVARIHPSTGSVTQTIQVGNRPAGLAFGNGSAWVANSLDGTVSRIDSRTNQVRATIATGNGTRAVAVDRDGVWVSNEFEGTLARIDPRINQVVRRINVGNRPQGVVATAAGSVLVSVRQGGAGHRGGTLTVRMNRPPDPLDTAVAYDTNSWPILRMTGDGLVAFNQASGLAGTQLVPDLAVSLPNPTDGGRTYTFRLRPNIRFSNGRLVKPSDIRYTFERNFKIGKLPVQYYDGIVGAARCKRIPVRCDLSRGILVDDATKTVTFHLTAPDLEFLYKLALPFAYVVPKGTPLKEAGTRWPPATGPYMINSYRPKRVLTLGRNPYFHEWSQAAQPDGYPDKIVFEIGGTPDDAMNDVVDGKADVFSTYQSQTPPSERRLAAIKTQHASQVHTNPQQATIALFLNTRLAPFDRLGVRRALNYAADRSAAVQAAGGPDLAQATCQILPPNFPGYRPYCGFSAGTATQRSWTAPDLAKARALIAASGTRGMKITVWSWELVRGFGPYAVKLLRSLGYRASLKVLGDNYFSIVGDSRTKAQIGTVAWISDYPAASGFFNPIFTCASFSPNSRLNVNDAAFCDPRIDRQIKQASFEQATNPDAARGLWERIDRQTVNQAPWVPLVTPKSLDVLSKRVGNYQYSPAGGMLFDQLWVK